MREYSFDVQVFWTKNGKRYPFPNCRVTAESSSGFAPEVYTDEDGVATVYGVSQRYNTLYLNGKSCGNGPFVDGGSYRFTIPW
jgi:hypothetical protein